MKGDVGDFFTHIQFGNEALVIRWKKCDEVAIIRWKKCMTTAKSRWKNNIKNTESRWKNFCRDAIYRVSMLYCSLTFVERHNF